MKISDYDYTLPEERIALHPPEKRGTTRLLVLDSVKNTRTHKLYSDLPQYLHANDVVILNNTKVIKARIIAQTLTGTEKELLLLEQHSSLNNPLKRRCLYRGKLHEGEELRVGSVRIIVSKLHDGGVCDITSTHNLLVLAEQVGSVPLPPYMKRQATKADTARYQTVFAKKAGSVAAPTASLNFTKDLEHKLKAKGVKIAYLTLHVGLGTFLPIRSDEVEQHQMHSEYFEIPDETAKLIQEAKKQGRKITAVGTTVTRTLEYAASQILSSSPGHSRPDRESSQVISGEADIFIYPSYKFKIVDQLLTNFHAPRSTVLMMAAAFAGWDNLKAAYEEAINEEYNFLSYGDSMLIN